MCKTIRDYETKFGEIWIRNEAALGFFQIASAQEQQQEEQQEQQQQQQQQQQQEEEQQDE